MSRSKGSLIFTSVSCLIWAFILSLGMQICMGFYNEFGGGAALNAKLDFYLKLPAIMLALNLTYMYFCRIFGIYLSFFACFLQIFIGIITILMFTGGV
jgi:hypothetical protein